ncbi:MAG: hypothetical protein J1E36_08565, partial [Eubacterium sp.]|nr:hypothetical protein [Eubacterium sp.]
IREEKLDSPLVVHKKSDASYQETAAEVTMNATHTDDDSSDKPTLERHRFRKEKKKKKWPYVLLVLVAIAMAVLCALVYSDVIPVREKETTTTTTRSYTTQPTNDFEGIITIKGTYIFFEGEELDGIKALEKEIKYLDEGTKFVIQDENADSNFLNFEVLSTLSLYNIDYEIKHIVSSGLKSRYEDMTTTTQESTATTQAKTTEKESED